jgi:sortase A
VLKNLERSFWVLGAIAALYCAYFGLKAFWGQASGRAELEHELPVVATSDAAGFHGPPMGSALGRLDIPRLGLSTIVFEGDDEDVLDRGAGHLTGSALLGDTGNTVLAAHRDTFFRPLRNVRVGDTIRVHARSKDAVYRVESTTVVQPEDTYVLNPTREPSLTLITCYPFRYIGPAPERFVVRAVLAN